MFQHRASLPILSNRNQVARRLYRPQIQPPALLNQRQVPLYLYAPQSTAMTNGSHRDARYKKSLTYWFKATWWFTTRESSVNAVNLKGLQGIGSYQTAWSWLHKLRRFTIRDGRKRLSSWARSMNSSSVVNNPENAAVGRTVKALSSPPLKRTLTESVVYACKWCPFAPAMCCPYLWKPIPPMAARSLPIGGKAIMPIDRKRYRHSTVIASRVVNKNSFSPVFLRCSRWSID